MANSGCSIASLFLRISLGVTFLFAGLAKIVETIPVSEEQAAKLRAWGVLDRPGVGPGETAPADPTGSPTDRPVPREPSGLAPTSEAGGAWTPVAWGPKAARQETRVRQLYMLALMLDSASEKPSGASFPLWPGVLAREPMPVVFAWAVALTELLAGGLVLIGLLSRLSAWALAFVMLGAMWLTEFGPALQTGRTYLGFIPRHGSGFAGSEYMTLFLQMCLFSMAVAVAAIGPGACSLDRALCRKAPPKPAPKPAPAAP
jgi:uncharacterized membrane protein YphA (DoxX/SURF4 family)